MALTIVYWGATTGSPALASIDANWVGGTKPDATDIAAFRSASSNYDCTWDIATTFGGFFVEDSYTGTIDLDNDIDR